MKYLQTHVFPLTIDFDLLDAGNVVHHPNYLVLCERARSKALDDVNYSHGQLLKEQTSFVLTETHSKYLKPALLGQKLSVLTKTLNFSIGLCEITTHQSAGHSSTINRKT